MSILLTLSICKIAWSLSLITYILGFIKCMDLHNKEKWKTMVKYSKKGNKNNYVN